MKLLYKQEKQFMKQKHIKTEKAIVKKLNKQKKQLMKDKRKKKANFVRLPYPIAALLCALRIILYTLMIS